MYQINMLYTLNIHNVMCHTHFNKTTKIKSYSTTQNSNNPLKNRSEIE